MKTMRVLSDMGEDLKIRLMEGHARNILGFFMEISYNPHTNVQRIVLST